MSKEERTEVILDGIKATTGEREWFELLEKQKEFDIEEFLETYDISAGFLNALHLHKSKLRDKRNWNNFHYLLIETELLHTYRNRDSIEMGNVLSRLFLFPTVMDNVDVFESTEMINEFMRLYRDGCSKNAVKLLKKARRTYKVNS